MFRRPQDLTRICIPPATSLRRTIEAIDLNECGIVLLCDNDGILLGAISDGDVRRAILAGKDLDGPVVDLLASKDGGPYPEPVTASVGSSQAELRKTMRTRVIRQLPLVDDQGRVADLVLLRDLIPDNGLPVQAVVMAGGLGTRLRPLTEDVPKPLLPVGERPIMEYMIKQLKRCGVAKACVASYYKSEKISSYFGDGQDCGIELEYIQEEQPLGTAGALGLMADPQETLLVVNGDILTNVDFTSMHNYHIDHQATMTVALSKFDMEVPFGVVDCNGPLITSITEKPRHNFFINAGIYLLEPEALSRIPKNVRFDMTDLMEALLREGLTVVGFPIREYWLDVGEHKAYQQALEDIKQGRLGI